MYSVIRPLLFNLDPERAHSLILHLLRLAGILPPIREALIRGYTANASRDVSVETFGLKFKNPVGLAAGYDKDGLAWRGLATLGFGHLEIGTVTHRPQAGNPKPRIFRIPEEHAVINRMGFPGRGADFIEKRVTSVVGRRSSVLIGINIGKNKDTPNEEAAKDYVYLLEKFYPYGDYFAVNVSSPNTVGLRRLQAREYLEDLLSNLARARLQFQVSRPILVKIAPDLTNVELDDALAATVNAGMDGVIATNTTISREMLRSNIGKEFGGLSGAPLTEMSRSMVAEICNRLEGNIPVVGVGGIMNPDNAKAMIDAGATLIQVYTGLIYSGPGLARDIVEAL